MTLAIVLIGVLGVAVVVVGWLLVAGSHADRRRLEIEPEGRNWAALRRAVGRARRQQTHVRPWR